MTKLFRYLIHVPHGALAAVGMLVSVPLGFGWLALIMGYQFIEDWRIKDRSFIDWRGYMIGYAAVMVAYMFWRLT